MKFVFIGAGIALIVFGLFQASVLFIAISRGVGVSAVTVVARCLYAGVGVSAGLWLLSLGGVI